MTITTLRVRGMRCAGCVNHVEQNLKAVPGVAEALVNLATEQATVTHDAQAAPAPRLVEAVQQAGYEAEVPPPEEQLEEQTDETEEPAGGGGGGGGLAGAAASAAHAHGPPDSVLGAGAKSRSAWNWRLVLGIIFALPVVVLSMTSMTPASAWAQFLLALPVQILLGWPFYRGALRALRHGRADMDTLVALGTTVAFVYSAAATESTLLFHHPTALGPAAGAAPPAVHVYFDTAVVILVLIGVGKYLEARARASAAAAIRGLLDLQPAEATVVRHGHEVTVPVGQVRPGDLVLVRPGQRVPVDGQVVEGASAIDQSMVTGESMPVEIVTGDSVIGGTVNQTGAFRFRAVHTGKATLLAHIIRLVNRAQASKARVQRLADAVAAVFVPIVLLLALATLLGWGFLSSDHNPWQQAMQHMVAVLIVACPCALGLATPTAIMVGTGLGARHGILIKDAAVLERAGKLTHVILDKTGTLTMGQPSITDVVPLEGAGEEKSEERGARNEGESIGADPAAPGGAPEGAAPRAPGSPTAPDAERLLELAASVEALSEHPLGRAIMEGAREAGVVVAPVHDFESITGGGVRGNVDGRNVLVGKPASLRQYSPGMIEGFDGRLDRLHEQGKTVVAVVVDGKPVGLIALADRLKPSAAEAVAGLHRLGLKVILMTGDHRTVAQAVARKLGIDDVIAEVLPGDKHAKVVALQKQGDVVAMVGDGINDAPALAAADIGIAMGGPQFRVSSFGFRVETEPAGADAEPEAESGLSENPKLETRNPKLPSGGTDIAMEAGHVVLVGGDLTGLVRAVTLSRATMRRIHLGLFWAFIYNLVLIPVAVGGYLHPIFAAAAMAFSSVSVVLNALWLRWAWKP